MQLDARHGEFAVGVFLDVADRAVFIAVDDETFVGGEREKRQHVAARQRGDERRFRVDQLRIAEVLGRGGAFTAMPRSKTHA